MLKLISLVFILTKKCEYQKSNIHSLQKINVLSWLSASQIMFTYRLNVKIIEIIMKNLEIRISYFLSFVRNISSLFSDLIN